MDENWDDWGNTYYDEEDETEQELKRQNSLLAKMEMTTIRFKPAKPVANCIP